MKLFKLALFAAVGFLTLTLVSPYARADYLYYLDQTAAFTSGSPFGIVDLAQTASGVTVKVAVAPNYFVDTGAGDAQFLFEWSGTGLANMSYGEVGSADLSGSTISSVSLDPSVAVWLDQPGSFGNGNGTPGTFNAGVLIPTLQGGSVTDINYLNFTLTGATLSDLTGGNHNKHGNFIFAADIGQNLYGTVKTGLIWTSGPPTAVPEPSTLPLLLVAVALLGGGLLYRRKRKAAEKAET